MWDHVGGMTRAVVVEQASRSGQVAYPVRGTTKAAGIRQVELVVAQAVVKRQCPIAVLAAAAVPSLQQVVTQVHGMD